MSGTPSISVILCTFNPHLEILSWGLDCLESQQPPPGGYEVVVVDNCSDPPLEEAALRNGRRLDLRVVREPRLGLTHARCRGIRETRSPLLVFVDDDIGLDPDYLVNASRIACEEPAIGHYGGAARPRLDVPASPWQLQLFSYLGIRDHGSQPVTSLSDPWGKSDPIGAGMVCRREVAEEFVRFVCATPEAARLGRSGTELLSGEDTLIARTAQRIGYACSYQPSLRLVHHIEAPRLRFRSMARLLAGHGRSYVVLDRVLGHPPRRYSLPGRAARLAWRLLYHCARRGPRAGVVAWCWDWGFFRESADGRR